MKILRQVDLSVPVDASTTVYPGDPVPSFSHVSTVEEHGCAVHEVSLGTHTGTHVDAPFHVDPGGARIHELDLGLFSGEAVLVDATSTDAREEIGWDAFAPVAGSLRPGAIVLLHTGWSRHYGTEVYGDHPYLGVDARERLLASGVRTLFLDTFSPDEPARPGRAVGDLPCHRLVARAGGVIGENFRGFDEVTWPDPFVVAAPLRLTALDGAPVRAVAMHLE